VAPTSRWAKIVGRVTGTPAAYFEVPPPPEISVVVPFGSTLYSASFHATTLATVSIIASLGCATS
jgi:hypothetical protein